MDGVIHTASPVTTAVDHPNGTWYILHIEIMTPIMRAKADFHQILDVILPALKGVTGLLQSALSYGYGHHLLDLLFFTKEVKRSRIQRIVLTSSCAAILDTSDTVVTVSEKDWNDQRVLECNKFGRHAAGLSKYSASKTLAERG